MCVVYSSYRAGKIDLYFKNIKSVSHKLGLDILNEIFSIMTKGFFSPNSVNFKMHESCLISKSHTGTVSKHVKQILTQNKL